MTFLELLERIQSEKQSIFSHHFNEVLTEDKRYILKNAGQWELDEIGSLHGKLHSKQSRGGLVFFWGAKEEVVENAAVQAVPAVR